MNTNDTSICDPYRPLGGSRVRPWVLDVGRVRSHFDFPDLGRVVTNNAASTQPPRELAALLAELTKGYENVHRGQSAASQQMTELFEASYDTFAQWLNAPSRRTIVTYRNATEAINTVMYSLLTDFRDGDNVVTTMLEHNSDFVPWYGHVPRDLAALRASRRVPDRPLRPSDRRTRRGPPRRAGRPPDQALSV